ncbi:hypothetical protein HDU99_004298, partial [Rhizoclosmatium hyalinum]
GGEGNQSLVLSEDVWGMASAFVLDPVTRIAERNDVYADPVLEGDGFKLTCVLGKRIVASLRERKLMTLLAGDVYSVISASVTGSYLLPSAMNWSFVSVDK